MIHQRLLHPARSARLIYPKLSRVPYLGANHISALSLVHLLTDCCSLGDLPSRQNKRRSPTLIDERAHTLQDTAEISDSLGFSSASIPIPRPSGASGFYDIPSLATTKPAPTARCRHEGPQHEQGAREHKTETHKSYVHMLCSGYPYAITDALQTGSIPERFDRRRKSYRPIRPWGDTRDNSPTLRGRAYRSHGLLTLGLPARLTTLLQQKAFCESGRGNASVSLCWPYTTLHPLCKGIHG
jgi:hypothetical protein